MVYKKPVPTGLKTFRVPQTTGVPGWIVLTYDNTTPVCYWLTTQECKKIFVFADERICGDTILRAEKISDKEFIIADIWMYNSNCVFACSTYMQRYQWLKEFLPKFIKSTDESAKFIHRTDGAQYSVRGYERHLYEPGKPGYYEEKDKSEELTVIKLTIPDCYEIPGKGYLRVPDLKTSLYLRSKGETFTCKCLKYDEEYWDVRENIPEVDVNAP